MMSNSQNTNKEFEIYIRSLTGKTIILRTSANETILDLKQAICEKEGILPSQQRLTFKSKHLSNDNLSISQCGIESECTINLVVSLANDPTSNYTENESKTQVNESWYYLQKIDDWQPLDQFMSLILCCRFHQNIRSKFALYSVDQSTRYLFQFCHNSPNEKYKMFEPMHCLIAYGKLDQTTKCMIEC